MLFLQVQSEKLLTWNMAVRDFHLLVKLVKVCQQIYHMDGNALV